MKDKLFIALACLAVSLTIMLIFQYIILYGWEILLFN